MIGFAGPDQSSVAKGETIWDTVRTVCSYADIVAIRHPKEGAALVAAKAAALHGVPVINAGDGGHLHPTQTLADLVTIHQRFSRLSHLTVGLCGDLLYGRTVHSLVAALCRFGWIRFVLISPPQLDVPQYVLDRIAASPTCCVEQARDLTSVIDDLDVLYMTRVQGERFTDPNEYARLRDTYVLDEQRLASAKSSLAIMHPLPRVNEIAMDVDADPRAAYFDQVRNGMLARMALMSSLLGDELPGYDDWKELA